MDSVILGEGQFTWSRYERMSDRYGTCSLMEAHDGFEASQHAAQATDFADAPVGKRGKLVATVLATRRSHHIGDLFRGLYPPEKPPAVGSVHLLGEGTLFVGDQDPSDPFPSVGLRPDEERATDWLDPAVLYTIHDQTVRLEFVEDGAADEH